MSIQRKKQTDAELPRTTEETSSSRLTLPYIDTRVRIKGVVTLDNARSFAVPGAALIVALLAWSARATAFAMMAFLFGLGSLSVVLYFTYTNPYYLSTRERIENVIESRRLQGRFPYGYSDALGRQIHGVERFYRDGTAKMADGRRVGLIGVSGMNTKRTHPDQAEAYTETLSSGIDEQIKDLSFSIYATTSGFDSEELVTHHRSRAEGTDKWNDEPLARTERASRYVRELLIDMADWFVETNSLEWDANKWEYYVITEIHPSEIQQRQPDSPSLLARLLPGSIGGAPDDQFDTAITAELDDRLSTIESAIGSVEGVETERVDVLTHTRLLLQYWSGEPALQPGEEVSTAMANDDNRVKGGETPTERMLTPSGFDVNSGRVEIGDELCKTYCIMDWPVEPDPLFLHELFTICEANVDVRIHVDAVDKQQAIEEMERHYADVESEEGFRQERQDASRIHIQSNKDAVAQMYYLLRNTTTQPWDVSMYVTVRVGPEEAHEYAKQTNRQTDDLYLAKVRALEDASEQVLSVLTSAPASLGPRQPSSDAAALDMIESSSPTGTDLYHESGDKSKQTRMLGGAVAAMFPWCSGVMQEPGGLRFGRNKQNGSAIVADPFKRGAPHLLTLGQTRSGKTYAVETALAEWFCADPDRTLVVCDTEQGFEGLTRLCGGKQIVVDGKQTINPFDIQKPPQTVIEGTTGGTNHFQMKIDEVTSFFAGILRAQGIDPSRYMATIEDAVQETYMDNGITRDPQTHSEPSPTIAEFIDVLKEMLNDPGRYTFTGHDREAEQRISVVSDLLDKLSGFKEDRKYHHMVGETETGLLDPAVDMAYVDLSQFSEASEAEKSVMLHLIFGQVYQKVKRTRGEIIFLIDEAHFLLHSKEMIEYLQDAARSWARYDAALWFVTQSPREFIERAQALGESQENQRRTILDQCSTIQTFRTPRIEPELLMNGLGQNRLQAEFVRDGAVTGKSSRGFSECLVHFQDREGWWESRVQASPFEDLVWNYESRRHGDFDRYIAENWDPSLIPPSVADTIPDPKSTATGDGTTTNGDGEQGSGEPSKFIWDGPATSGSDSGPND